jgi:hypothetical protein
LAIPEAAFLAALEASAAAVSDKTFARAQELSAISNQAEVDGVFGPVRRGATPVPFSGELFIVMRDARELPTGLFAAKSFYVAAVRLDGTAAFIGLKPSIGLRKPSLFGNLCCVPKIECKLGGAEGITVPGRATPVVPAERWGPGLPPLPGGGGVPPIIRLPTRICIGIRAASCPPGCGSSSPPAETCNGKDDDNDELIDEGSVCANHETTCACQPVTCAAQGVSCGTAPDGCGGSLNCGLACPEVL